MSVTTELATQTTASAEPTRRKSKAGRRNVWLIRLAIIAVILGAWELSAAQGWVNPLFSSRPSDVAPALWDVITADETPTDLRWTLSEVAIGYVVGCSLGIAFGLLLSSSNLLRTAFQPVLNALNSVPRISLVPLFVAWFGLGMTPRIVMAITIVFFVMVTTVVAALAHPDRDLALLAYSLGASGRQRMQKFILPGGIPVIASGLELALIYSFLGVIAAEIVSGNNGLGSRMTQHANLFQRRPVLRHADRPDGDRHPRRGADPLRRAADDRLARTRATRIVTRTAVGVSPIGP